jgi:hypothetical protein
MVEARPEMVDNFSGENRNTRLNMRAADFEGVPLSLRLKLSDNRIGVVVQEAGNLDIEIIDLLFDPLNLSPATV